MNVIVAALAPLQEEQRLRALDYVLKRFGTVGLPPSTPAPAPFQPAASPAATQLTPGVPAVLDIRTLKETKRPRSANEMAALVAYYLSEIAPAADRKETINASDIERYFKSANFALPGHARFTLSNAKNAGYLDSAGTGQYKLNPVGYNLVVHRMGVGEGAKAKRKPRQSRGKRSKKAVAEAGSVREKK
ncbi:MAG TPA: hypothetical protein VLA96_00140 [Terriglobales bacterium]|nr:hypothetical protein [Terriglobales bacterium]